MWSKILILCSVAVSVSCGDNAATGEPNVLTVKAIEGEIAPFAFRAQTSITWLTDSTLAVADLDDQQVVIVTTAGMEVSRIGRKGMGPGEFAGILPLRGNAKGELLVGDMMSMRLSRFDADHNFVTSVSVPGPPWELLDWNEDRAVVMWVPFMPTQGPTVGIVDLETGTLLSDFPVFQMDAQLEIPMEGGPMGLPQTYLTATALRPGVFAFASSQRYRIVVMDDAGRHVDTFERPEVEREMPTEDEMREKEAVFRKLMATLNPPPPPEAMEMAMTLIQAPKPYFRPHGFATDDEGRLWIATERGDGHSTLIDVLDGDGRFLTTIEVPHQVHAMAFRLPMLATLVEHKDGEFEGQFGIHLYEVTAAPGS